MEISFQLFSFSFRLYDDGVRKGSVIIQGLEEVQVSDKQEVYRILERGSEKRRTAETKMNANSSRSHTVRFLGCAALAGSLSLFFPSLQYANLFQTDSF